MIKLIALDLDGTLIDADQRISNKNREAIKKCVDMGIMVSLHTARCAASTIETIKDLNLKGYHVVSSGASLINEELKLCYTRKIPEELVREVIQFCRDFKITFASQTCDSLIKYEISYQDLDYVIEKDTFSKLVPDMMVESITQNTLQITLFLKDNDPRNVYLAKRFSQNLKFRRSGEIFVNIIDNSAGKLAGLKKIMKLAGLKREELMAIGDTEVDLGMINFAGTGIAMGNSPEKLKIAADFVSSHCEKDGVSVAIDEFILQPLHKQESILSECKNTLIDL